MKTHSDTLSDFTEDTGLKLKNLAKKHNFLIMEDRYAHIGLCYFIMRQTEDAISILHNRKFADIGNTCKLQYFNSSISKWADLVTCHTIAGPGTIKALKEVN